MFIAVHKDAPGLVLFDSKSVFIYLCVVYPLAVQ